MTGYILSADSYAWPELPVCGPGQEPVIPDSTDALKLRGLSAVKRRGVLVGEVSPDTYMILQRWYMLRATKLRSMSEPMPRLRAWLLEAEVTAEWAMALATCRCRWQWMFRHQSSWDMVLVVLLQDPDALAAWRLVVTEKRHAVHELMPFVEMLAREHLMPGHQP